MEIFIPLLISQQQNSRTAPQQEGELRPKPKVQNTSPFPTRYFYLPSVPPHEERDSIILLTFGRMCSLHLTVYLSLKEVIC